MAKTQTVPGRAGGLAVVRQLGLRHMSQIAQKGGRVTSRTYGPTYMSLLGELGANAVNGHLSQRQLREVRNELAEFLA